MGGGGDGFMDVAIGMVVGVGEDEADGVGEGGEAFFGVICEWSGVDGSVLVEGGGDAGGGGVAELVMEVTRP